MKTNIAWVGASFLILAITIVSLGFWRFSLADGSLITICAKKSGLVYVIGDGFKRTDCRKNDQLLSWNAAGPQGIQGPKGEKGDKGDKGEKGDTGQQGASGSVLHLFDGSGQDLGMLARAAINDGRYTTYIKLDNDYDALADFTHAVSCSVDIFPCPPTLDVLDNSLYFTQPNCTGDAFIQSSIRNQQIHRVRTQPTAYFVARTGTLLEDRLEMSVMDNFGACNNETNHRSNTFLIHYITLPFTVPLAWPLRVGAN